MELLGMLVHKPLTAASMTAAALFRSIGTPAPTILFDEVQELFGRGADTDQRELKAVLNAGYKLGGNARRCVGEGHTVADFPVFCPKVLVGPGTLPTMLARRSVPILLKRKPRSVKIERYHPRVVEPIAAPLRQRLAGWAQTALPTLVDAWPELPEELTDRQQEIWEPLFAIADAAGGAGPSGPEPPRSSCTAARSKTKAPGCCCCVTSATRSSSTGRWSASPPRRYSPAWSTATTGRGATGGATTSRRNGSRAPPSSSPGCSSPTASPKLLRLTERIERGYERAAFTEPWALYCEKDATDVTAQVRGPFQHVTAAGAVTTPKPPLTSDVTTVTSENAEPGRFAQ